MVSEKVMVTDVEPLHTCLCFVVHFHALTATCSAESNTFSALASSLRTDSSLDFDVKNCACTLSTNNDKKKMRTIECCIFLNTYCQYDAGTTSKQGNKSMPKNIFTVRPPFFYIIFDGELFLELLGRVLPIV